MTVEIVSFGCRLNGVESETMRELARAAGHEDVAVINSCAVTAEASRQARQAVRRMARERPDTPIVVTGCAAQTEPDRFAALPEVAAVLGNGEKMDPGTWSRLRDGEGGRVRVGDIMAPHGPAAAATDSAAGRVRTFVEVQTGCDHDCTFCVIPSGRGRSRCAPIASVIEAVRASVARGAREIVLTGVDITAYGKDGPGEPRLGTLVKAILAAVPELKRLRLSSIDSVEVDRDLLDALAQEPRLMPHLHLSLQAGDDLVLKRMKRRHSRDDAVAFCHAVRRLRPDIVFGADLIAGFPTESDAMFARSLDLVAECGLTHLHVFPYSPRPGTPAARMPPVPPAVARERAARLRKAGEVALRRHLDGEVGSIRQVLVEGSGLGRTEGFAPVRFDRLVLKGELRPAHIVAHNGRELLAA